MNFYSLNKKAPNVSFKDAVIKGLAPDKGLYFPESITPLGKGFFNHIEYFNNTEIAYETSLGTAEYLGEGGDVTTAGESTPAFAKITLSCTSMWQIFRNQNQQNVTWIGCLHYL